MACARAQPSSPSVQWSTAKPLCFRPLTMNEPIFGSSSITRMRMDSNIECEEVYGNAKSKVRNTKCEAKFDTRNPKFEGLVKSCCVASRDVVAIRNSKFGFVSSFG